MLKKSSKAVDCDIDGDMDEVMNMQAAEGEGGREREEGCDYELRVEVLNESFLGTHISVGAGRFSLTSVLKELGETYVIMTLLCYDCGV